MGNRLRWAWAVVLVLPVSAFGWATTNVFWNFGQGHATRSVALALDPTTGDRYFVADVMDAGAAQLGPVTGPADLFYKRLDASGTLGSRVLISDHMLTAPGGESYLQTITSGANQGKFWVMAHNWSGYKAAEAFDVTAAGVVGAYQGDVADDHPSVDIGHMQIVFEAAASKLDACFTPAIGSDDTESNDKLVSSATWKATADVLANNGATTEDHCSLVPLGAGGRATLYHRGAAGSGDIYLQFQTAAGAMDGAAVNLTPGMGDYDWPMLAVRTVAGVETLHAVSVERGQSNIKYRSCTPATAPTACKAESDWSAGLTVNVGFLTQASHPELAVDEVGSVYVAWVRTSGAADRIRLAALCTGSAAFVDAGVVDATGFQTAWATKALNVPLNTGKPWSGVAVDDNTDFVYVAYVRQVTQNGVDWTGWGARTLGHAAGGLCP